MMKLMMMIAVFLLLWSLALGVADSLLKTPIDLDDEDLWLESDDNQGSGDNQYFNFSSDRPSLKGEVSTSDQPPGPTANEEHPDENRRDTSSDTGPVPDKGKLSRESSGSEKSEKQFLDGTEQQNENNNNPTGCCHDLFVEINLDEPAWCDQLLVSPEPSSNSVLPLSPFSFHSSSSSSSS